MGVDLKSLLRRLNRVCTASLEGAAGLCVSRSHYEVAVEHLLLKLVDDPAADVQAILKHYGVDPSRVRKALQAALEEFRSGNAGKPVFSPRLIEWFQDAWLVGSIDLGLSEIRSGALLLVLLSNSTRYTSGRFLDEFEAVSADDLKKRFAEVTAGSSEEETTGRTTAGAPAPRAGRSDDSALARFTIDFTARARAGEIDPVFGRDREIRQMVDILARRRKNNPIVVGEAGVGKTAVVEGLAIRVVEGDVPDSLKDVDILALDLGLLQAGAGMKGEFENRLKSVIEDVKSSPKPIVLFIDEAHTLIGAGGAAGMGDAANLLKPALARGELRTMAATTWTDYKKYFEKDPALARRFQLVKLDEPSEQDAVVILRGLREKYEDSHGVQISDAAVVDAARMSSRYISGRQLPDKAVDLLDTAAARVKIGLTSKPDRLEDLVRRIQTAERELAAYRRDEAQGAAVDQEAIVAVENRIAADRKAMDALDARWRKEKEAADRLIALRKSGAPRTDLDRARAELQSIQAGDPLIHVDVDAETIAQVVSDWTGVPVGKMVRDEAQSILEFDQRLAPRIKGQDHAIAAVSRGIRASKAGLNNPATPIGVFLFVGPSGVGKTEMATGVADLLFGGERFMVTINMSEFQEKHTVSRLIGSPPGYVGYGEGGVLTEAVRQRPYSVVLLDEVEKADPEVLNLFYQVFDKGTLSDGEGRVIDFKNTVVFLTSNLASDLITEACADGNRPDLDELIGLIRPVLSAHFKPALLARMTIVPFYPIDVSAMRAIAELKLKQVASRLADSHKMVLDFGPDIIETIAKRCTEVETGARNVDHILRGTLIPLLSTELLSRMGEGKRSDRVTVGIGDQGGFTLTFSER